MKTAQIEFFTAEENMAQTSRAVEKAKPSGKP
jgi:hypothetical protein